MKKYLIVLLLPLLAGSSCKVTQFLPSPQEFRSHVYGLHIVAVMSDTSLAGNGLSSTAGEIIAVEDSVIFIRTVTDKIVEYPRANIDNAEVFVASTSENPSAIATWALLNGITTVSHGGWAIITLPLNLAVGIPVSKDAKKGAYIMKYPQDVTWDQLRKFARFPQGMPESFLSAY